jgi:hypothetical protein
MPVKRDRMPLASKQRLFGKALSVSLLDRLFLPAGCLWQLAGTEEPFLVGRRCLHAKTGEETERES